MVDVISRGGNAGGDPPHPGDSRLLGQCESCKYCVSYIFLLF